MALLPRRKLGNTGIELSVIGFGASPLGGIFGVSDALRSHVGGPPSPINPETCYSTAASQQQQAHSTPAVYQTPNPPPDLAPLRSMTRLMPSGQCTAPLPRA